jgi:hypothetical protein
MNFIGDSGYKLGEIIYPVFKHDKHFHNGISIDSYSHLFELLPWWADREVSEMPEYVKQLSNGKVCRITNWHDKLKQFFLVGTDTFNIQHASDEVVPITGEEYREKVINQ